MRRIGLTLLIALAAVLSVFVFVMTSVNTFWYKPDVEVALPLAQFDNRAVLPGDHPFRLKIPTIDVDAHVQEVGINSLGNMANPSNFTDVGWYKYGSPPGFLGSAVITGHVDDALALDGVFKRLDEVMIGDDVLVQTKDGRELRFIVVEVQTYPYKLVPRGILFSRRDLPRLNLITCGGTWLPRERSYDTRLIVYAELVSG